MEASTFFVNALSEQKRAICNRMSKPRELKVRCYTAIIIDLNNYLDVLPGAKASDKIGETEINEIL